MLIEPSFKASDVVEHFKQLKANNKGKWWNDYVVFDWSKIRPGKNATKWVSIRYTNDLTVPHRRLSVIIRNEVHIGQIMPTRQEDVVELKSKFPEMRVEIRTTKPTIQFQKWSTQVRTQEDKVSYILDNEGKPVLPDDKYLSVYYQLASDVEYMFKQEVKQRVDRGNLMSLYLLQNPESTPKEIRDKIGHVNDCDTIIRDDEAISIRENYNGSNELLKGVLTITSTKICSIIQDRISDKAPKNKGVKLPNPMTRVTIPVGDKPKVTGAQPFNILDKSKLIVVNGKKGFDTAKVGDNPIDNDNIHSFIVSRSIIDGIVNMDYICFSQMGISLPVKAQTIIVQQPIRRERDSYSMCSEIYGDEFEFSDVEIVVKQEESSSEEPKPESSIYDELSV